MKMYFNPESVRERLRHEAEELSTLSLGLAQDPVFKELWDNAMDAVYDKI